MLNLKQGIKTSSDNYLKMSYLVVLRLKRKRNLNERPLQLNHLLKRLLKNKRAKEKRKKKNLLWKVVKS